jgi:hypothetical protein
VAVRHTPTQELDLERDKAGAIEKIIEENDLKERGFRIEDIAWLKKRGKVLGTFGTLGIWFYSAEGGKWMIDDGLLDERYIGRVEVRDQQEAVFPLLTVRTPGVVVPGDTPMWPLRRPASTSKMSTGH